MSRVLVITCIIVTNTLIFYHISKALLIFQKIHHETCPCNEATLTPHFYIVKLGFTGVFIMPLTLKKWGTYWFRLVCLYVCVCVCMYSCLRYRLETSCMDSSWKNSRRMFLVFPELSPLVKLRPFDKQGDEIL